VLRISLGHAGPPGDVGHTRTATVRGSYSETDVPVRMGTLAARVPWKGPSSGMVWDRLRGGPVWFGGGCTPRLGISRAALAPCSQTLCAAEAGWPAAKLRRVLPRAL